jgi:hypothetical protein
VLLHFVQEKTLGPRQSAGEGLREAAKPFWR